MKAGPSVAAAQRMAAAVSMGSAGPVDGAQPGDVFDGVVGGAEFAVGHAGAHAAELDVAVGIGDVGLDLLESTLVTGLDTAHGLLGA